MRGPDPDMLAMFLEEATDHLAGLEPDLLTLEQNTQNPEPELINRIFRAVHSVKGSAGFLGYETFTNLAHDMESVLMKVRDGQLKPSSDLVTALLRGTDKLVMMIADMASSDDIDIEPELQLLATFNSQVVQPAKAVKPTPALPVATKPAISNQALGIIPDKLTFKLSDLQHAQAHGHFLYIINIYTRRDLSSKGVTLLEYLNNLEKLGLAHSSYADLSEINCLDDARNGNIVFVLLFSSVLEPDLISIGVEVPLDQVQVVDIDRLLSSVDKQAKEPAAAQLQKPQIKPELTTPKVSKATPVKPTKVQEEHIDHLVNNPQRETLRVSVDLLNDLMTLAGELVLARNQLMRMGPELVRDMPGLASVLTDVNHTTTNLQGKIMDTRMQPIGLVFNKFPRQIRELGSHLGKQIQLELIGEDVELDKSIIEKLSDPLTHLVRNAADHGIETIAGREAAGKASTGKIWLRAYHESGKVNIEVEDDGKGIDNDRVLQKALAKGLTTREKAPQLTQKEILNFICTPGFSTSDKITDLSGRGVGMDVVRNNIEKLGGTVSVNSKPGNGTIVSLKLPLTLAIIPSLIITVANLSFAVPQIALKELVRFKVESKNQIEQVGDAPVMRLRNNLLPLVYLRDVLKLPPADNQKILKILVLKMDEHEFGLVVDEIFDSEEIVVKQLPRFFKESACYAGTTIMGDGKVALILDVSGIAKKSKLNFNRLRKQSIKSQKEQEIISNRDKQSLLLFTNHPDEYFAMDIDLIKRIEQVEVSKIETIGAKKYITHEGQSLHIINLEQFLPVQAGPDAGEYIYVIIPTLTKNPIGIVAHNIIDSVETYATLDTKNINSKGILGSALINDKIVLFPDIYELSDLANPERQELVVSDNNKFQILLVEDTPFFRALTGQYLQGEGYHIDTAFDGQDALTRCQNKQYNLLVVDLLMPRLDGFEFMHQLRQLASYADTPAIALTTLSSPQAKVKAIESGFTDYEIKVNKLELLRKVEHWLHQANV